jgi:hypothetical protein
MKDILLTRACRDLATSGLRVGEFRVIYREAFEEGQAVRKGLFIERRNMVYELFA